MSDVGDVEWQACDEPRTLLWPVRPDTQQGHSVLDRSPAQQKLFEGIAATQLAHDINAEPGDVRGIDIHFSPCGDFISRVGSTGDEP